MSDIKETKLKVNRRSFLRSTAAVGAGLAFSPMVVAKSDSGKKADDINVALLGAGAQGQELLTACWKMGENSGIRFKAVCDIWTAWNQQKVVRRLKSLHKVIPRAYVDYREMLDKEKDLDAVIIATPDFWHSEHTVACLKAGLHVYCEKEMSNTLEGARKMVEAARKTGKLLQIGHQRRSNPRYIYCYEKLLKEAKILGRITTINGQWNRSKTAGEDQGIPPKYAIDDATLKKYGFESMQQFLNWRWYKGLGGGPIVDLGSHQIDVYSWFLDSHPKSVIASGGIDYWKGHEWYDSVMAVYEYETSEGTVRAFYQTITTNSCQGYFEAFMGDEGTLLISESGRGNVYREEWVAEAKWEKWAKKGYVTKAEEEEEEEEEKEDVEKATDTSAVVTVYETPEPPKYDLPVTMTKAIHQPHLENFFAAIRDKKVKLNCPAEVGYETAVAVLKVNEAIEAGRKLEFKAEEFKV
jgi:predicted dehydrogenase